MKSMKLLTGLMMSVCLIIFGPGLSAAVENGDALNRQPQPADSDPSPSASREARTTESDQAETYFYATTREKAANLVEAASRVFGDVNNIDDRNLPPAVLRNAAGIAIVPDQIETEDGGIQSHAGGVLIARQEGQWSLPVFVTLAGTGDASFADGDPTDYIVVFNNRDSLQKFVEERQLALDAGQPVTADANEKTTVKDLGAITFAHRHGRFEGVSLEGSVLNLVKAPLMVYYNLDEQSIRGYFGTTDRVAQIILGLEAPQQRIVEQAPESADMLRDAVRNYTERFTRSE